MAIWYICNTSTGIKREMDPGKIEAEIKAVDEASLMFVHIWSEGWPNWRPLKDIPELMVFRKPVPPPMPAPVAAPPPMPMPMPAPSAPRLVFSAAAPEPEVRPETAPVETGRPVEAVIKYETPTIQEAVRRMENETTSAFKERRRHMRFMSRLRVIIVCRSIVFRAFSRDCSTGGIRLEHPVPQTMVGEFVECYISRADMKSGIRFKAKLVGGATELLRFEFVDQDPRSLNILQEWLAAYRQSTQKAS